MTTNQTPARKPATRAAAKPTSRTTTTSARKPATRAAAAKPAVKAVVAPAKTAKPAKAPKPVKVEPLAYTVLTGIDDRAFCERVSAKLSEGYELYGSPSLTFNGKNVIVAQALFHKGKKHGKGKKK